MLAEPVLAAALLLTPAGAVNPPAGVVSVTPAAGIDTAAIRVTTPAGCPPRADSYHAIARGHGFPAGGQVVTAPTGAGISHTAGFDVYFAQTMKDFTADNGSTPRGRYDVSVYCADGFTGEVYAEFTGAITFTTPTTWTSGTVPDETSSVSPGSASSVPPDGVPPAGMPLAPPAVASPSPASRSLPAGWIAAAIAALALAFETGRRYGRRTA